MLVIFKALILALLIYKYLCYSIFSEPIQHVLNCSLLALLIKCMKNFWEIFLKH